MHVESPRLLHPGNAAVGPPRGALERMPKWLICIPLVIQWSWLALRHGSVTLPTAANPRITSGGLVGEGKLEYFDLMGPLARARHRAPRRHPRRAPPDRRRTGRHAGARRPGVPGRRQARPRPVRLRRLQARFAGRAARLRRMLSGRRDRRPAGIPQRRKRGGHLLCARPGQRRGPADRAGAALLSARHRRRRLDASNS